MPFVIRDKMTGEIVKMQSGKSVWSQKGHAKAAFATSGCYVKREDGTIDKWGGWYGKFRRFDEQDRLEIVEAKIDTCGVNPSDQLGKVMMQLAKAEALLAAAHSFLDDVHAYDSSIAEEIRSYFEEGK